jgi:glutamyl-tRNA reductase
MLITSRTKASADLLASAVGGRPVAWDEALSMLGTADIVVTATGSQRPILTRAQVEAAMGRRRGDPLFIIDLAVPRDVEVSVGDLELVFLYNIDDLQSIVQENLSRRTAEIQHAEAIVSEELVRFASWQRSRGAVPTIVALRQRFDAIRRSELQRLEGKLAGLPPDARARVDEVTRLLVEKLLLDPTEQLKALPDEETQASYTEAVNRLFRLRATESTDVPDPPTRSRPSDRGRP